MTQLIEFLGNHIVLTASFVAILGMLVYTTVQNSGFEKVGPADATRMINHENALVLDVRTDPEYNEGHILDSMHIPASQLAKDLKQLEKHRDRPIIAACRTGQRSAGACGTLRKNGFEKVYNLRGGILAWQDSSLPLTKK